MINDDELRATLADRERNAPDIDAVRREITGRSRTRGRWSGRGPVLLAAAGVAALTVLTAVIVIGARGDTAATPPAAAPTSSISMSMPSSSSSSTGAPPTALVPPVFTDQSALEAPNIAAAGSVVATYRGSATATMAGVVSWPTAGSGWVFGWDVATGRLVVTISGSGSCPPSIVSVSVTGRQELTLSTAEPTPHTMCTTDDVLYTSEIVVPDRILRTKPLAVLVLGGRFEVPPVPKEPTGPVTRAFRKSEVFGPDDPAPVTAGVEDHSLEAQWSGGRLFITTVGSSSSGCEPSITSVERSGPQKITLGTGGVQNGTPVPTTVIMSCSMDLSPLTSEIVLPPGIVSTEPLTIVLDGVSLELPPAS